MPNNSDNISNLKLIQTLKEDLDELIKKAEFWPPEPSGEVRAILEEAEANFISGGSNLLNEAKPYLWMYYKDVVGNYSPKDRIDYGIPNIAGQDDIWKHISFRNAPTIAQGNSKYEPGRSYISFEGDVAWEEEHGLQLVFEHGLKVCKVGPYDGHYTNAHAYADDSLVDTVYK